MSDSAAFGALNLSELERLVVRSLTLEAESAVEVSLELA